MKYLAATGGSTGRIIVNADDWGRDRNTTDRIVDCVKARAVTSLSAMVFMADSERAAAIAREADIPAGLHLNFTEPFAKPRDPSILDLQHRAGDFLRYRVARVLFHPGLADCFRRLVESQIQEFIRLYGSYPERIDGHHHMHLCANVLMGGLLSPAAALRPHFSFERREKVIRNALFRCFTGCMAGAHRFTAEYLFSLPPLVPSRLERIFALARQHVVELETHPVNPEEHDFLAGQKIFEWTRGNAVAEAFHGAEVR